MGSPFRELGDEPFEEYGPPERSPEPPAQPEEPGEPKKKRATFSSTAATLKWARKTYGDEAVGISSWWQAGVRPVRKDLLGFIDAIVLDGLPGVLALQACGADISRHIAKMDGASAPGPAAKRLKAEIDAAKLAGRVRRWLAAGNRLLLVGWREVWVDTSARTKRKQRMPRFLEARLEDHPPGVTLGLSDREVTWTEREQWPPIAAGRE